MAGLGAPELIIILMVVLLLFGTARLPKLARSIGEASREFKRGALGGGRPEREDDDARTERSAAAHTPS